MPTAPEFGKLVRERVELSRTRRALSDDVDHLIRQKATLSTQLEILRHEVQAAGLEDATESFAERNRRFFESFIEREVYRVSREDNGRFSALVIDVHQTPPAWFASFVHACVRVSDIAVRQGGHRFWIFLHDAGALGRRLFVQRLAANYEVATRHHGRSPTVAWGGASYPRDGETAGLLLERAVARREPLPTHRRGPAFAGIQAPRPARDEAMTGTTGPGSAHYLLPPKGLVTDTSPHADPRRIVSALQQAVRSGRSGELIVRAKETVGRVYIYNAKIAWAHCSLRTVSLAQHLTQTCGADREEVRFAFEQCRKRGGNFAETLIDFGTFTREEMRGVLLLHLRRHMDLVLRLEKPDIMFLPQTRAYKSDLLFPLASLVGPSDARQAIVERLQTPVPAENAASHRRN